MKSLATSALQSLRTPHYYCLSSLLHPLLLLTSRPLAPLATVDLPTSRTPRHCCLAAPPHPAPPLPCSRPKSRFRACDTHSAAIPY
jgi:hypothetical protein